MLFWLETQLNGECWVLILEVKNQKDLYELRGMYHQAGSVVSERVVKNS